MKLDESLRKLYDSDAPAERQRRAFLSGEVPVAVYGLGKMGLPIAGVFADAAGSVVGVDIDQETVDRINRGECPIEGEPGLPELIEETVAAESLVATTESRRAADAASLHVVIVPTTIHEDGQPDLSNLRTVVRDIADGIDPGDVVLVESTVPPRTSRAVVARLLGMESDLSVGEFGVAFCPERTSSGRALEDIRGAYPRVVGGVDDESARVAELVYGEITDNRIVRVSDATTAECVKVFEGVYRDVNIALANELARLADELGVSVNEAIDAANTQPFCDLHDPGIGVGGHCIPYYPHFLIEEVVTETPLLERARAVNEEMPTFAVRKLVERFLDRDVAPEDATVLLLGVAYRPGVAETGESPAIPAAETLDEIGATVLATDPVLDDLSMVDARDVPLDRVPELDPDGIVLVTAHEAFDGIDWSAFDDPVIVDGRAALDPDEIEHDVYTIGGS
jgi:UDP-N-acetyl-D-mannosaminuronic acid dehydrogenase